MDKLKSLVIEGAIEWAVLLSIRADIPSGPLALDESSDCNSFKTSDLEHSNSCGQTLCGETLDAVFCELLGKISYGTMRLGEQSPEIQLGCMRGLGGSEQPAPSEAF